jgi:hypothetical protein
MTAAVAKLRATQLLPHPQPTRPSPRACQTRAASQALYTADRRAAGATAWAPTARLTPRGPTPHLGIRTRPIRHTTLARPMRHHRMLYWTCQGRGTRVRGGLASFKVCSCATAARITACTLTLHAHTGQHPADRHGAILGTVSLVLGFCLPFMWLVGASLPCCFRGSRRVR